MKNLNIASKKVYCEYASGNYGIHALSFTDALSNTFYFSYDTLIAFASQKSGLICLKNYWSTTTGKHLNAIQPDHKKRVDNETFEKIYQKTFNQEI